MWIVNAPAVAAGAPSLLTADETRRARRFALPPARDLFLASRALQRTLGSRLLGVAAQEVTFDRTCVHCGHHYHGKPRLVGLPSVDYSVSHSGAMVALAYADGGRVGVDVEADQRRTDLVTLIPKVASEAEQRRLAQLAPDARRRAFLRLWTRKEAVVKLTGHGLAVPFTQICAEGPAVTVDPPPPGWPGAPVWIRDLSVDRGHPAALASSPEAAEVAVQRVASLDQLSG